MADKNEGSCLRQLAAELLAFGRYVQASLADPAQRDALRATLGLALSPLGAATSPPPSSQVTPGDSTLAKYVDGEDVDVLALLEALTQQGASIKQRLRDTFDEAQVLALDLLATNYVYQKHPKLYFTMQFFGWMAESSSQFGEGYTTVDRALSAIWGLLGFLIVGNGDPLNQLTSEGDAQALSNPTLRLAALVLIVMRIAKGETFQDWAKQDVLDMLYGWDGVPQPPGAPIDPAELISRRMLSVRWHARDKDDDTSSTLDASLGVSMALVPKEHGGPGLFVAFSGGEDLEFDVTKRLRARVQLQATALPLWLTADDVRAAAPAGMRAALSLSSQDTPDRRALFAFPDTETLRFEVGGVSLQASIAEDGPAADLSLRNCVLAFDASKIDGFIGSLLPDRKTKLKFNIGKRYVSGSGWNWTGEVKDFDSKKVKPPGSPAPPPASAPEAEPPLPLLPGGEPSPSGLQRRIQIGKSLGPVRLDDLQIGLSGSASGPEPRADVTVGVSVSAHIGPVFARVDHVGLRATLTKPVDASKANLWLAHLDLDWLAPRAVGITVDAKAVKGGGFVFYDPDKQQYAGVLELEISRLVSVKAIGLIATRLPGGAKGYSLVIVITAEGFKPIRLPMGFALAGIGGLVAIHRTCSEEALREGLRTKTLDLILFPKDPVQNAPNILAALQRVFPAQRGSYVLGPMLRITWGVPTLITMDLALLIEWGVRDRFIVLGRISAILPNAEADLLRLRMDALGVFDFDQGSAAIDAVLVDSKLLKRFVLTGAMAMRMRWQSPRGFALAVGGMHRSFTPPASFPKLERLALSLTTGDNPRLTCEAYFALTANTVQFGAAAHLYAAAAGFNVTGDAGFDVLIQLSPFHFLAEFAAGMQIRKGSHNLFKVKVEGALEGPRPLALRAKATFEILWWDVSIRVNVTLVEGERPAPPPAISALAQLLDALRDGRNWHSELPRGQSRIVVLRDTAADSAVPALLSVHPLGTLSVRQGVVPLNTTGPIDRFGDAPVSGERQFTIRGVSINRVDEDKRRLQTLREDFAPAQFFDMPDERKLTSPSFVPMDAGVQIGSPAHDFKLTQCVRSPLEYETKLIDRAAAAGTPRVKNLARYALGAAQLEAQARYGAAGRSVLRRDDPVPVEPPRAPLVKLQPQAFAVIDAAVAPAASIVKQVSARTAKLTPPTDFVDASATLRHDRRKQVVPAFEVTE
jgi:hypothetical protein